MTLRRSVSVGVVDALDVLVPESGAATAVAAEVPKHVSASPLFGVALLKMAMELKRTPQQPLDDIIAGVLARMDLPEVAFREFVDANGGLLRSVVGQKGVLSMAAKNQKPGKKVRASKPAVEEAARVERGAVRAGQSSHKPSRSGPVDAKVKAKLIAALRKLHPMD